MANVTKPRLLLPITGSSGILALSHTLFTAGLAFKPNCTMNPGSTRKNATLVEEPALHQIVEAIRAVRRPIAMHFHNEIALGGHELRFEDFRGFGVQRCRIHQRWSGNRPVGNVRGRAFGRRSLRQQAGTQNKARE